MTRTSQVLAKFSLFLLLSPWILWSGSVNAQYTLYNDAFSLGADCFSLTQAFNNQSGAVWSADLINLNEDFVLVSSLYFGTNDATGADGIAFILRPLGTSLGSVGGGMGYEGINPSLAVEFDTWQNTVNADPVYDHVAIQTNGNGIHSSADNLFGPAPVIGAGANIEDGNWHDLSVYWYAGIQRLEVYFDCALVAWYDGSLIDLFEGESMVFYGYTAATGGSNNNHRVCFEFVNTIDEIEDVEVCQGEGVTVNAAPGFASYTWTPTTFISDPGSASPVLSPPVPTMYYVSYTDECGQLFTDSVFVDVHPIWEQDITLDLCEGDSTFFDGTWISDPGLYTQTLTTSLGCDSIINLQINALDTWFETFNLTACEGESVNIGGDDILIMQDTIITEFLESVELCDSTVVWEFTVTPILYTPLNMSICEGDSLLFNSLWIKDAGVYIENTTGSAGCDSIITLELDLLPVFSQNLSFNVCEGTMVGIGSEVITINSDTLITEIATSTAGCDSTINYAISVAPFYLDTFFFDVCQGDSVFHDPDWITLFSDTLIQDLYSGITGCDSLIVSVYTVYFPTELNYTVVLCEGDSFFNEGDWITEDGIYSYPYVTAMGCDSVINYSISFQAWPIDTQSIVICLGDSVFLQGAWQDSEGTYIDTLVVFDDCDLIRVSNLELIQIDPTFLNLSFCEGDSVMIDGSWVFESGIYEENLLSADLCDSLLIYSVNVIPNSEEFSIIELCEGELYEEGGFLIDSDTLLIATNLEDCIISQTLINFEECEDCFLEFPNAFTPNGDGLNDFLRPITYCSDQLSIIKMSVYNRWGENLWNGYSLDDRWDGTFNNKVQELGSYIYIIEYKLNGETMSKAGSVTLIR